jgi:polyisoprenoid-binding protein YceI
MNATPNLERSLRYLMAWAPAVEAAKTTLSQRAVPDAALHAGTVSFQAQCTFGQLLGSTSVVTGAAVGAHDLTMARGWVEADVATFGTGGGRRDRALREGLDIGRHPTIHFSLRRTTVVSVSLGARDVTTVLLHGALTVRGTTRRTELPATITRTAAITRVTSAFPLDLADYGVDGLRRMLGIIRVNPVIQVRVNLWFVDRVLAVSDDERAERRQA